jgi:hypothetical protein
MFSGVAAAARRRGGWRGGPPSLYHVYFGTYADTFENAFLPNFL